MHYLAFKDFFVHIVQNPLKYKVNWYKNEEIYQIFLKSYQKKLDPTSENQWLKDLPEHGEQKGMVGKQQKWPGMSISKSLGL